MTDPATDTTTTAAATTTAATTITPDAKWYAGVDNAELRGMAELKGWKGPGDALESYRQLEKTIGAPPERILRLPEKADAPEWAGIKEKLGFAAPAKAEDYGLQVPEGIDPAYAGRVSAKALELGIPKTMLAGLAEFQNKEMADMIAADQLHAKQDSDAQLASLRKEWGEQFDGSSELAKRAANEFGPVAGLTPDDLNAMEGVMGTAKFLKMWAAVGSKSSEAKFVDGGDPASKVFSMSPDAAKARIAQLSQDSEWFGRWSKGGITEQGEWARLNRIAAGAK